MTGLPGALPACIELPITDLSCAASEALTLESELRAVPGVVDVYVNPISQIVYVDYDPERCDPTDLQTAIKEAGFLLGERPAGGPFNT